MYLWLYHFDSATLPTDLIPRHRGPLAECEAASVPLALQEANTVPLAQRQDTDSNVLLLARSARSTMGHRRMAPPGSPRWTDGFCTRYGRSRVPPAPGSSRWSGGFLHMKCRSRVGPPSPGLARWSGGFFTSAEERRSTPLVPKLPLRGSPVGGVCPRKHSLVQKPTLHRDEPGGGREGEPALLVQKPPLHRGKPGGDASARPLRASSHLPAQPASARSKPPTPLTTWAAPRYWLESRRLSRRRRAAFASSVIRASGAPPPSCFNNPRAPGTAMCSRHSIARRPRNCSGSWSGPLSFARISSTRRRSSSVGFSLSAFRSMGSATSPSRSSSRTALVRRARLPVSSSPISRARCSFWVAAAGRSRSCRKGTACSGTAIRAQTARYARAASAPASASHRTGRSFAGMLARRTARSLPVTSQTSAVV